MRKHRLLQLASVILFGGIAFTANAQDDLLVGKPIYPLGGAMTWTAGDASYTFITDDLQKLVAETTNTSNVFLYPENGTLNTAENQAKGAQVFYIDMGTSTAVGSVYTTWEGAAADSYNIYLTDNEPTTDILTTTPTFSISGLGQYTANTAVLDAGSKGRYLVFQVTKATNWGWGVKIRSISAMAPVDDVLTTFTVSPAITVLNEETPLTITLQNQLGVDINPEEVEILVSDNATYVGGNLIIKSGDKAELSAKMNDVTLTANVYVATAPTPPAASSIKTPIYTNTLPDNNSTAEFTTDWNGGAKKLGEITFDDGQVAQSFGNARCIFLSNTVTTGAWNGNIDPSANGYRTFNLDVFATRNVDCTIEFESVTDLEGGHTYTYPLTEGEWTSIAVNVAGATKLGNLSIRFTEANMNDILLSNIYFTPTYVEGDEQAPVLGEITYTASMTEVEFTMSATDDLSPDVYFNITDGVSSYSTSAASGEKVTYTVSGLKPSTEYTFTITANDGKNVSEPKVVEVKTDGLADSTDPSASIDSSAVVVYSSYMKTELPVFDNWSSTGKMEIAQTDNGNNVLLFSNFMNQWGGLVNLDLDVSDTNALHMEIYGYGENGNLTIAPVWQNAANTPNQKVTIVANEWNTVVLPISDFGYPTYGSTVTQLSLSESTLSAFAVDNIYFYNDSTLEVGEISSVTASTTVDVYTIQGILVRSNVSKADCLNGLPAGIYIVGGKKAIVRN